MSTFFRSLEIRYEENHIEVATRCYNILSIMNSTNIFAQIPDIGHFLVVQCVNDAFDSWINASTQALCTDSSTKCDLSMRVVLLEAYR